MGLSSMEVYFDGDSWTYGAELEDPVEKRFSTIISRGSINKATGGSSNQRIVRHLLEDDISHYDYAVIQMTIPSRTEYYDEKFPKSERGWVKVTSGQVTVPYGEHRRHNYWSEATYQHWKYYYENVYTDKFGSVLEKVGYNFIRNHCKRARVPLILMTINPTTQLKYDIHLDRLNLPLLEGGHPNEEGHAIIAEEIQRKINE